MARSVAEIKKDLELLPAGELVEIMDWITGEVRNSDELLAEEHAEYHVAKTRYEEVVNGSVKPVSGSDLSKKIKDQFGFEV